VLIKIKAPIALWEGYRRFGLAFLFFTATFAILTENEAKF